jgi:hypothetical protein
VSKIVKEEVQKEILALLNDNIENNLNIMGNNYPVAMIAREILREAQDECW